MTNCSNNYGPFHFPEKLIPLVLLNALEGKPLPVYGDGDNVRDWLFVEDHARALALALERGRPGETYCVGGRSERRNLAGGGGDLRRSWTRAGPRRGPRRELIRFVADRPGHDQRYAIDPSKAERELGWRARESFESGLARTVEWYLANEWWWRPLRERRYAGERLGLLSGATASRAGRGSVGVSGRPLRVLVAGREGQLARALAPAFAGAGWDVAAWGRAERSTSPARRTPSPTRCAPTRPTWW